MILAKADKHSALTQVLVLGPLALMVSGPFLLPFHTDPIPSFWQEWWAGTLGLAAASAGLAMARGRPLALPLALGIPGCLLVALLLQLPAGKQAFPELTLLHAAYLLWAALLMMLGRQVAETMGQEKIADLLAGALLCGALIGAGIAVIQWLGLARLTPWIFADPEGGIGANVGQRNHHAHFSWLGIASAFYLHGRGRVAAWLFWPMAGWLAFASILGGARSIFLYALVPLSLFSWAHFHDSSATIRMLRGKALQLLLLVVALNFFAAWASPRLPQITPQLVRFFSLGTDPLLSRSAPVTPGEKLFAAVSGPSIRLALARTAWSAFRESPWVGQGAGSFAWASFTAAAASPDEAAYWVMEHAHNLPLQIMAEFGGPAAAMVAVLLIIWTKRLIGQAMSLARLWCATILGVGLLHALLEYPHWYAYFLGPTALLLGAFDAGPAMRLSGKRISVYLLAMAIGGAVILANLRRDYISIETITYRPLSLHPDRETAWRMAMDRLLRLHRESLLSPWALLGLATMAQPSSQLAAERVAVCTRAIRLVPARRLVAQCALQHALAGKPAAAEKLLRATLRAFPAEKNHTLRELEQWSGVYPVLVPLLAAERGQ